MCAYKLHLTSHFIHGGKVSFFDSPLSQRDSYASFGTFTHSWQVAFMLQEESLVAI